MASLPIYVRFLHDGYAEEKESGILRTEFESGPPRQTRFKTRVLKTRSVKLYLDSKQHFLDFETWFSTDLQGGALFFTMTDPITSSNIEARFVGGIYNARPMTAKLDCWEVDCKIESWGT
jgi:hypothetical protein